MPDGRWTSSPSAPGCATSKSAASGCRFPTNGYRGDYVRPLAQQLQASGRRRAARAGAEGAGGSPRRCAAAGTRRPTSTRSSSAPATPDRRAGAFAEVLELSRDAMLARHPRRSRGVRRAVRPLVHRSRALAASGAIDHALTVLERAGTARTPATAPRGSAPPSSATRRTGWWCARTARRPTSPPISPITWKSASAASSG